MRNISFALTTAQFRARTKTVTRRNGWRFLRGGETLMGVERGMGLKKGETVQRLGPIRVLSVRREPLRRLIDEPEYGAAEVIAEGFPNLTPAEFIAMYCKHNRCDCAHIVTRIEFEHLCPDAGRCTHEPYCDRAGACYRTSCCGPLSGVFPNNEWPDWAPVFTWDNATRNT